MFTAYFDDIYLMFEEKMESTQNGIDLIMQARVSTAQRMNMYGRVDTILQIMESAHGSGSD